MSNTQLPESVAVLAAKAGTASNTPLETSYVSIANFDALMGALVTVAPTDAETLDFAIYQATDSSGTSAKILKAATQRAAHATNNDAKVIVVGARKEELDMANSFTHVAVRCTTSGATGGVVGMFLLGGDARYEPVAGYDNAAVVEVKL